MSLSKALSIFIKYLPSFLLGIRTTLLLAFVGTAAGFLIGLAVGGIRAIRPDANEKRSIVVIKKIYDILSGIYIEVFRGTPMMVQAVFIYYFVYTGIVKWDKMIAALFVISVNTGAYMSEIIRAGIQAVDKGQNEAARALGMSSSQTMMNVILPQAIKNVFPAIGNELIVNIKDSSVLMIISITELMFQSSSIAGTTYKFTETYFLSAMIYLSMTVLCAIVLNTIEKRLLHTRTSMPQSITAYENMKIAREETR